MWRRNREETDWSLLSQSSHPTGRETSKDTLTDSVSRMLSIMKEKRNLLLELMQEKGTTQGVFLEVMLFRTPSICWWWAGGAGGRHSRQMEPHWGAGEQMEPSSSLKGPAG